MTTERTQPLPPLIAASRPSRKSRLLRAIARAGGGPSRQLAGRGWFPLWAILHHVGRTTGRAYAIPVAIQRTGDGFLVPIPFGEATQWVRNVLAAGTCKIRWRGRDYLADRPRIVDWADARHDFGRILRPVVPIAGIRTFLRVTDAA